MEFNFGEEETEKKEDSINFFQKGKPLNFQLLYFSLFVRICSRRNINSKLPFEERLHRKISKRQDQQEKERRK